MALRVVVVYDTREVPLAGLPDGFVEAFDDALDQLTTPQPPEAEPGDGCRWCSVPACPDRFVDPT